MATIYDGHGVTLKRTLDPADKFLELIDVNVAGFSKVSYETTLLANTAYKTKKTGALKEWTSFTANVQYNTDFFDFDDDSNDFLNDNSKWVMTFPNAETITFWGHVTDIGDTSLQEDNRATCQITIVVTNFSDDADPGEEETEPAI